MYKAKIKLNSEQLIVLKATWLQMFEDHIREKRLEKFHNDLGKSVYENQKDKDKLMEEPYSDEERLKIRDFERKIDVEVSFGILIENKDIFN